MLWPRACHNCHNPSGEVSHACPRTAQAFTLLRQVDLQPASVKVGGGVGADEQTEAVQRRFEVLYLDEAARVVRFLPDADSDSEPQLFVFERDGAEAFEDEVCSSWRTAPWKGYTSPNASTST